MGCLRFCFVLIPTFLTLCAVVLSAIACAGATGKNKLLTSVYEIKLDLSDASLSTILGTTVADDITVSDVGLSDVYIFGMWGYCQGTKNSTADSGSSKLDEDLNLNSGVTWTHCSKPKAMYVFDPVSFFEDELDVNSTTSSTLSDLASDLNITLPSKVEDYITTAKAVCKLIFICTIIGIVLAFVTLVLGILTACCCGGGLSCLVVFTSLLSTISLALACAASTGAFAYVKKEFNNAASDYGISASMSKNYMGAYWGGVAAGVLATVCWFVSSCCVCCGTPGPSRGVFTRRAVPDDEKPMLVYSH